MSEASPDSPTHLEQPTKSTKVEEPGAEDTGAIWGLKLPTVTMTIFRMPVKAIHIYNQAHSRAILPLSREHE
ncbi:hypothetical protein N7478_003387 [Penicillium angulare]|uniref:uncharacterized protein n=1 Tax=Penicillium angulare TaxID=116970 RepID=UPI0025416D63|nr:uncharacterized protein N7478_003387 [Penicillium angulare]KAJ5287701.1 hypothetical protein N7478_003387 [Penicillium angulare]